VTHALVRVPLPQAGDASGLLTTTIQLGQAVGVATFGSLFLTLDSARGPVVSGHALAVTFGWLAAAMVLGVAGRVRRARRAAAPRARARFPAWGWRNVAAVPRGRQVTARVLRRPRNGGAGGNAWLIGPLPPLPRWTKYLVGGSSGVPDTCPRAATRLPSDVS